MAEKLCIFCEHFKWSAGSCSEYWGHDGGAECDKGHFGEYQPWDEDDLRSLLLKAEKCADYTPPVSPTSTSVREKR